MAITNHVMTSWPSPPHPGKPPDLHYLSFSSCAEMVQTPLSGEVGRREGLSELGENTSPPTPLHCPHLPLPQGTPQRAISHDGFTETLASGSRSQTATCKAPGQMRAQGVDSDRQTGWKLWRGGGRCEAFSRPPLTCRPLAHTEVALPRGRKQAAVPRGQALSHSTDRRPSEHSLRSPR